MPDLTSALSNLQPITGTNDDFPDTEYLVKSHLYTIVS
jgi:hypothetical protein